MKEYKDFAINIAKEAGAIIKQNFVLGMRKEWKEDKTPLTATDIFINKMVVDAVKETFPDYGIISEEGSSYSGQQYTWICDPVDGTIPFSHGIPTCMFLLSLVKDGKSILGVSYDPFMDNMYYAELGGGAFLNGKKISVSRNSSLDSRAGVGLLAWKDAQIQYKGLLDELLDLDIMDFRVPSVGYMDMLVACGEFVAVIFPGSEVWDSAAAKIIVEEAGGKFTDLLGGQLDFRGKVAGHLASNGIVHDYLLKLIKKYINR